MKAKYIIVGFFVLALVFVSFLGMSNQEQIGQEKECETDNDCVPATCCHPTECVPKSNAPNCSDVFCTQVCEGPLDCGAGKCVCEQGNCAIEPLE